MAQKVILLACGSYNPPTNMHLRMFEVARDHLHRMGQHIVIGGLISPVHDGYGKKDLESATHRVAMVKLALQNNDWVKVSDWECKQETWSRTKHVLQYHQNHLNSLLHSMKNKELANNFEDNLNWIPDDMKSDNETVKIKLLCGADLLESFATPGLWLDEDIEAILGHHGLIVVTRSNCNPAQFIYNSDLLTKYMHNILIVTEWIQNEVSSTKIRRALKRSESVKYLLPDRVIEYITKYGLYGVQQQSKYILTPHTHYNSAFLTPSPSDMAMESPSPTNCINICNNNLFSGRSPGIEKHISIDTVDSVNRVNALKLPGQAVKIITDNLGEHTVVKDNEIDRKEVRRKDSTDCRPLKSSKSCGNFDKLEAKSLKSSRSNSNLKECKSCDENLIKFIFTKHGIQVISDVETIV